MGNTCCQTNVDPVLIDSIPQFYDYNPSAWPEEDEFIKGWIKENQSEELKEKDPMKHKLENKYFLGNWNNGAPEGRGIVYEPGIVLYDGLFKNGQLEGPAKIQQFKKNCEYEGDVENGKASGHGVLRNKDGKYLFEGEWEQSKPKTGTLRLDEDPNVQRIQFKDFTKNLVEIFYTDGRAYYGQIDVDSFLPNGSGKVTFPNQSSKDFYEGSWKHGAMAGQGKYVWKDGSHYEGSYRDGKKEGFGRFYFASGNVYQGEWENGKQEGLGTLFDKNGTEVKQGTWVQGKLSQPMEKQQYVRESQVRVSFMNAKQEEKKAEEKLEAVEEKQEDYIAIEQHKQEQDKNSSVKGSEKKNESELHIQTDSKRNADAKESDKMQKDSSKHQMEKEGEKDVVENKREVMNEEKKEENNDDIKGSQNPSEQVYDENKEEVKKSEVEKESDKKDNDGRPGESYANKIE